MLFPLAFLALVCDEQWSSSVINDKPIVVLGHKILGGRKLWRKTLALTCEIANWAVDRRGAVQFLLVTLRQEAPVREANKVEECELLVQNRRPEC